MISNFTYVVASLVPRNVHIKPISKHRGGQETIAPLLDFALLLVKSSGTNYFLYMTRINNINYCFYIDRKIAPGYTVPRIIATKYGFSESIFNDTLGLLPGKNIFISGKNVSQNPTPDPKTTTK